MAGVEYMVLPRLRVWAVGPRDDLWLPGRLELRDHHPPPETRASPVRASASQRTVEHRFSACLDEVVALRELLGDHHDRLPAREDSVRPEDDLFQPRNVEMASQRARQLLSPRQDLPKSLDAVLDDQMADGDRSF